MTLLFSLWRFYFTLVELSRQVTGLRKGMWGLLGWSHKHLRTSVANGRISKQICDGHPKDQQFIVKLQISTSTLEYCDKSQIPINYPAKPQPNQNLVKLNYISIPVPDCIWTFCLRVACFRYYHVIRYWNWNLSKHGSWNVEIVLQFNSI